MTGPQRESGEAMWLVRQAVSRRLDLSGWFDAELISPRSQSNWRGRADVAGRLRKLRDLGYLEVRGDHQFYRATEALQVLLAEARLGARTP